MGVSFSHVSFCEKIAQAQRVLCRDFPKACVFSDQWGALDPADRLKLQGAKTQQEVDQLLSNAEFVCRAQCKQHNYLCKLNRTSALDMSWFGAPCVDDSTMGPQKMDNGASRLVTKSFLASLKKVYKPKIAISENVCTGNIGRRVVENVKDVMQSKVIFTQPSDVGFGCVARRRSFTILLRHDSGRFILDPQDTYDKLCAGLNDSQLSLHDLLACTTEADVLRELPEGYKLSPFEQSNLDQYQDLLDGKGVPIPNQVFAVNQNPNKVFKAAMAGILPAFTATDKCLWSRGNRRPILAYEKFLGHGWPMTQELCQALKIPVFSMDGLSNAHQSVGNGQHLVCAALALLPTLASVELFPEASPSMVPSDYHNVEINPQANGRCLFSCIYLHFASDSEKAEWSKVDRNAQGFPSDAD